MLLSTSVFATNLSEIINNESLIIADKSNGKIFVYNPTNQLVISSPALFGKEISDEYSISDYNKGGHPKNVTPAGEFRSRKYISHKLNEPVTAFIEGTKTFVAIHPIWLGNPEQQREERMNSLSVEDNRITNGCINVPEDFYFAVLDKLRNGTKVIVLSEGDKLNDDISNNPLNVTKTVTDNPILTKYQSPSESNLAGSAGFSGLN